MVKYLFSKNGDEVSANKEEVMRTLRRIGVIILVAVLCVSVLGMTAAPNMAVSSETVREALSNARVAVNAISSIEATNTASAAEKQAAIDAAHYAINVAVRAVNGYLANAEAVIESTVVAIEAAYSAITAAAEAAYEAREVLGLAEENEAYFPTLVQAVIAAVNYENYSAARSLVDLENAVTTAWNGFVAAQNEANEASEAALASLAGAESLIGEDVAAAIRLAAEAQLKVDAALELLGAWRAAEAALAEGLAGELYEVAEARYITRNAAVVANSAAVEALRNATETVLYAVEAINEANVTGNQVLEDLQYYQEQLSSLIEDIKVFDGREIVYYLGGGIFEVPPPEERDELPDDHVTRISRIVFNPIAQWGGDGTNVLLNWDIDPWLMIEVVLQMEGGDAQANLGNPSNPAAVGNTQNIPLAAGSEMVLRDPNGLPRSISTREDDVVINITVRFWLDESRTVYGVQNFWATGTLQNTGGGSFHINSLDPEPPQPGDSYRRTVTLSVGQIYSQLIVDGLTVPELAGIGLDALFMADTHELETPEAYTPETTPPEQTPGQPPVQPIYPITPGPGPGPMYQITPGPRPAPPAQDVAYVAAYEDLDDDHVPLAEEPVYTEAQEPQAQPQPQTRRVNPQTGDELNLTTVILTATLIVLALAAFMVLMKLSKTEAQ